MYPDYEYNNYPMSITDDDGPFLIMEAELSGDVELNDELKKDAGYRYGSVRPGLTYMCPHGAISLTP